MKDLPHHLKKLNRRILRSAHREELEALEEWMPNPFARKQTVQEQKKIAKRAQTKARRARAATPPSPEERNRKMKNRVPIFDRTNNAKPKATRPTHKKTPRI